jgi:hypothetical protein
MVMRVPYAHQSIYATGRYLSYRTKDLNGAHSIVAELFMKLTLRRCHHDTLLCLPAIIPPIKGDKIAAIGE